MADTLTMPGIGDKSGAERAHPPDRSDSLAAAGLVVVISLLMQTGAALAVKVISGVGVVEALWLRTALGAAILIALRPRSFRLPRRGQRWGIIALTLCLFGMNLSFYAAISRVNMGIVVAVEFLGPLAVSILGSRRRLDALWIVLAGMGVVFLAGPTGSAAPLGVSFALLAAFFWAAYLLLAKRALSRMEPLQVTVLMLAGSSLLLTPIMVVNGIQVVGKTDALLLGLAVAVLSSALPYLLDLFALRRVRASTYGVLLSIAPAMAALVGFAVLSQRLAPAELGGIGAVVLAAGGASWMSGSGRPRREEARVELAAPSD